MDAPSGDGHARRSLSGMVLPARAAVQHCPRRGGGRGDDRKMVEHNSSREQTVDSEQSTAVVEVGPTRINEEGRCVRTVVE